MIPSSAQSTSGAAGGETLPTGFAQAQTAGSEGVLPVFDLQLANTPEAQAITVHALSAPAAEAEVAEIAAEPNVEQWLQGMLDQQQVQVEAREGQPEAAARDSEEQAPEPLDAEPVVNPQAPVLQRQAEPLPAAANEPVPKARVVLPGVANAVSVPALALPVHDKSVVLPTELSEAGDTTLDFSLLERSSATHQDADGSTPTTSNPPAPASQAVTGERALRLHGAPAQWGEQMLQSLREHVDLQINQRIQNATIRLDPPELGSLEIYLSHESGRLNVHLSAANGDVARLLQQTSERLRQELVGQNFVQVNVQVSADAQGGRQQGQTPRQAWAADEQVVAASILPSENERNTTESARDVLVTV